MAIFIGQVPDISVSSISGAKPSMPEPEHGDGQNNYDGVKWKEARRRFEWSQDRGFDKLLDGECRKLGFRLDDVKPRKTRPAK